MGPNIVLVALSAALASNGVRWGTEAATGGPNAYPPEGGGRLSGDGWGWPSVCSE